VGKVRKQFEWAAVACSDLLEIATRLQPEEFKLYFIVLALTKRKQGQPGSSFNGVVASHRQLRHFFGPTTLRRVGRLLARLTRKGFLFVLPVPGKPSEILLDRFDGPEPARYSTAEPPASLSRARCALGLARGSARATSVKRGVPAEREKGATKERGSGTSDVEDIRNRNRNRRAEGPPAGELTPPTKHTVPPLFDGLTALLSDSGFLANLDAVSAQFEKIAEPAAHRENFGHDDQDPGDAHREANARHDRG
jgi:hypothetical protein